MPCSIVRRLVRQFSLHFTFTDLCTCSCRHHHKESMKRTRRLNSVESRESVDGDAISPSYHRASPTSSSSDDPTVVPAPETGLMPRLTTRAPVCTEVINKVLPEFITEDSVVEIEGRWDHSLGRTLRRRDICSILVASKTLNVEATKLIHDRSSIKVYLPALKSLPRLARIGSPGPWNAFRSITIYMHQGHGSHFQNSIFAIMSLWRVSRRAALPVAARQSQQGRPPWRQVQIICYEPYIAVASSSRDLILSNEVWRYVPKSLRRFLKTPV